ncbi:MAG: orotate phosphoribosyltransferase [Gallionella sp.]|jgi:orotate phosphoribosyltransferase
MFNFRQDFIRFAVQKQVLRFGEFQTKAGRMSPYFFNAGLFNDGDSMRNLSQFYAQAIMAAEIPFDMIFGPAYKGIPLATGVAIALAEQGRNVPYAYNRKEAKDHGEGGTTVGAKLQGRVLIIDDVISAGTSVRESIELIRGACAEPCAVVIALDRMERGLGDLSAVQEVRESYGIPVVAIANLNDLLGFLQGEDEMVANLSAVRAYRDLFGVEND